MDLLYKVMLVEDEIEVLNSMMDNISWQDFGFQQPVGCRNGLEAINMLKDGYSPDIIITDIYMPFADGLEVAQFAKENLPETIVVILSGYDDFRYAQRALKLKVHDYLLKPITPKALTTMLTKVKEELDEHKDSGKDSTQILRDHFLNRLLSRQMDCATIDASVKETKIKLDSKFYIVGVLDVDMAQPKDIEDRKSTELMRYALFNIAQELAPDNQEAYVFMGNDSLIKTVIGGGSKKKLESDSLALFREITDIFKEHLDLTASCGIGSIVSCPEDLPSCQSQALLALQERFFVGRNSMISYSTLDFSVSREIDFTKHEENLIKALRAFDEKQTKKVIISFSKELEKHRPPFDKCIQYCQKMMTILMNDVREIVPSNELVQLEEFWEAINFYSKFSLKELEDIMLDLVGRAYVHLNLIRKDTATLQMIKAQQYIGDNFADPDLSLNQITDYLAVSTSYFSANFKSYTGNTFVEYLTALRIEKAKQILSMTNKRTYEVASEVGYSDPHYFSSTFKKNTGISPKDYRESHHEEGKEEAD